MPIDEEEIYQEHILDHYEDPFHRGHLPTATHAHEENNPLCGDVVRIELELGDDGKISDCYFAGQGCVISQASASLMTDMLVGRTVEEAEHLMGGFLNLVKGEGANGLADEDRERLEVMGGISEFPMRVKCATLAWHTMKSALEGGSSAQTE